MVVYLLLKLQLLNKIIIKTKIHLPQADIDHPIYLPQANINHPIIYNVSTFLFCPQVDMLLHSHTLSLLRAKQLLPFRLHLVEKQIPNP